MNQQIFGTHSPAPFPNAGIVPNVPFMWFPFGVPHGTQQQQQQQQQQQPQQPCGYGLPEPLQLAKPQEPANRVPKRKVCLPNYKWY